MAEIQEGSKVARAGAGNDLREEAELAVLALIPLLPLRGSWNSGYELTETVQTTLHATPEEWGTAAYHTANLQRLLLSTEAGNPLTPSSVSDRSGVVCRPTEGKPE